AGDDKVEIVEGLAAGDHAHDPAFRRLRVDVVEMLETGGIAKVAEQRQSVPPFRLSAAAGRAALGGGRRNAQSRCEWRGSHEHGALNHGSTGYLHGTTTPGRAIGGGLKP